MANKLFRCRGADESLDREVTAILIDEGEVRCPHFLENFGLCVKDGAQYFCPEGLGGRQLIAIRDNEAYKGVCPYASRCISRKTRELMTRDLKEFEGEQGE